MLHRVWAAQMVKGRARAPPGGHCQEQRLHPLLQDVQRLSPKHHQHHPFRAVIAPAHQPLYEYVPGENVTVLCTSCMCFSRLLRKWCAGAAPGRHQRHDLRRS